jgi:hypothetical protein
MRGFDRVTSLSRLTLVAGLCLLSACAYLRGGQFPLGANIGLNDYPGKSGNATRLYLASLDFSQTDSIVDTTIPCHDAADCSGGSVRIRIVPEKNAYKVPVDEALKSGRGYIVAQIENKSQSAYKSLNLSPDETAYLWVGGVPAGGPGGVPEGARRIAVVRINREIGGATWLSTARSAGWCVAPPGLVRSVSAVHLKPMPECVNTNRLYSIPMKGVGLSDIRLATTSSNILSEAVRRVMAHRSGLWFSCSLGCCEATDIEAGLM